MRILLISDSHGNNEAVDEIITKWADVDLYLHAGDCECHPRSVYPFRVVRGNCDYSFDMVDEMLIPTSFGNILMRHKKEITAKKLEEKNAKVFIYGHTHVPECTKRKGVAYINPGSLAYPRSELGPTYMVLDIKENIIYVHLFSFENHKLLKRWKVTINEKEPEPEMSEEERQSTLSDLEELEQQLAIIEQEIADIRSKKKK